jgi:hypothetical protein
MSIRGRISGRGEEGKERVLGGKENQSTFTNTHTHTHIYEDSIMKPTKQCLKKGRKRKGVKGI